MINMIYIELAVKIFEMKLSTNIITIKYYRDDFKGEC